MQEFIQQGYAFIVSLGIDAGVLLTLLIAWIKTKVSSMKADRIHHEVKEELLRKTAELDKKYQEMFDAYQQDVIAKLTSLEQKVLGKIEEQDLERKEEIEKETLELKATIEAVNKKASIDEILSN